MAPRESAPLALSCSHPGADSRNRVATSCCPEHQRFNRRLRMATTPLKIILTNDDGFSAPGITTLYNALVAAGFDVHIVAPAVNQSAQGSSLGGTAALDGPINITEFSPGNFCVDGKPAAAALTALDDLFAGDSPDLIISGTNRGDNIGESENISGTVNGALQGLFEGVPAIAVSTASFNNSFDTGFS